MAEMATLAQNENRVKDEIKRIQEYVWNRHVEGSDRYDHSIDEEEAVRILDEFYSGVGNRNSQDQVYLGILLFERAFEEEEPETRLEVFRRAKRIFLFYRKVSGETDWPAVEDRLEDINAVLAQFDGPDAASDTDTDTEPLTAAAPADSAQTDTATATAVAEAAVPAAMDEDADSTVAPAEPVAEPAVETEPDPEQLDRERREKEEREKEAQEKKQEAEREAAEREAREREAAEAFIADLPVVEGMQLIPAGTFLVGPDGKDDFHDSFYMDKTPVTNEAYLRFVRETGYRMPRYAENSKFNGPGQPVVGVSFADAQQYAKWAGKEIPDERQWEKAARGSDGRVYPWGNDPPGASDACFGQDPREGSTIPVGASLRNVSPFGVTGMCGNVWEWTRSPFKKGSAFKVVRGGSYNDPGEMLATYFRLEAHPKDKSEAIGFRCVKNIH